MMVAEAGPVTTVMIRHGRMTVAIAVVVTASKDIARAITSRSERAIGVAVGA